MLNLPEYDQMTFEYLDSDTAKEIASICRRHGATAKRVPQGRDSLGKSRVIATFRLHSWAASIKASRAAFDEVKATGLRFF